MEDDLEVVSRLPSGERVVQTAMALRLMVDQLAVVGEATTALMIETAHALAGAAARDRSLVLEGQGHDMDLEATGPVIQEFLRTPHQGNA